MAERSPDMTETETELRGVEVMDRAEDRVLDRAEDRAELQSERAGKVEAELAGPAARAGARAGVRAVFSIQYLKRLRRARVPGAEARAGAGAGAGGLLSWLKRLRIPRHHLMLQL